MHNIIPDCSDNVTYTAGYIMAGGTTVNGESRVTLKASAYEVPLSSMQSAVHGNKREDRKYESLEATYALPHEYATVGPNEAKVLYNLYSTQQ